MNQFAYNPQNDKNAPQVPESIIINSATRAQIRNQYVDPVQIHNNHKAQIQPVQILLPQGQPIQQQPNVSKPKHLKEVPATVSPQKEKIRILSEGPIPEYQELTQSIDKLNTTLDGSDQVVLFLIQDSLKVILDNGVCNNKQQDKQIIEALQLVQNKEMLRNKLLKSIQLGTKSVSQNIQKEMNTYINKVFSQRLR